MKCPHCLHAIHVSFESTHLLNADYYWYAEYAGCPNCGRAIIRLAPGDPSTGNWLVEIPVYPKAIARNPVPPELPKDLASDYKEACLVMAESPKASAALSRRCLQHLLREAAKTTKRDLADQIDEVMPHLPSSLQGMIDAVRVLGNFAAHPLKSTNTGEIVDVEPGEAEWLLDTLEQLFDHYYVKPAEIQRRRDALNHKLQDAGKPPLK